jgi:DNA repair ATPase RecN
MCPFPQDAQLPQDDETRRLRAAFEACRAEELAAADQLSKPRHSVLYPAYTRLLAALGAVRLKCNDIRLAIRAHRKELRDKGK